jgi:hypothetical protein
MTKNVRSVSDFRNALSMNFDGIVCCLCPMAFAHTLRWNREEDYLNNLKSAINMSSSCSRTLHISSSHGNYLFRVDGAKMHKRIWVDFQSHRKLETCEIGDVMIISKYIDSFGILSRHVCFLQVKAQDKRTKRPSWKIDRKQLELYKDWPPVQSCYTGRGSRRKLLAQNLRIRHKDRLFSSYLLIERNAPSVLCKLYSWVTGTDLIAAASKNSSKIKGPLELPFLGFLIQLLFQTVGERDTYKNKPKNSDVKKLVDKILHYVQLNDPPEGEGKPFLIVTLTIQAAEPQ